MSNPKQSRIAHKPTFKQSITKIIKVRELGLKSYIGCEDDIVAKVYSNFDKYKKSGFNQGKSRGGIFNLEFSLDG